METRGFAACGAAIPEFRMDRQRVERIIPLVVRAAGDISNALGYVPAKRAALHGT